MSGVKRTFYSRVRRTAFDLWRGPGYVEKPDEDNPFGGRCILRLAMRKETLRGRLIEARAVYALLEDETQPDAILRAVFWDSETVWRDKLPETTPVKIPARFVQVPVARVRQWISSFDKLPTSIQTFAPQNDKNLPICTLRVETNYVSNVFEQVWLVVEGENVELTRAWQEIWQQMGQALQTCPAVMGLEESFHHVELEPDVYDFQAYQPSLDLP